MPITYHYLYIGLIRNPGIVPLLLILPTGSQPPKITDFGKSTLPLSHVLLRLSNQSLILKQGEVLEIRLTCIQLFASVEQNDSFTDV